MAAETGVDMIVQSQLSQAVKIGLSERDAICPEEKQIFFGFFVSESSLSHIFFISALDYLINNPHNDLTN